MSKLTNLQLSHVSMVSETGFYRILNHYVLYNFFLTIDSFYFQRPLRRMTLYLINN